MEKRRFFYSKDEPISVQADVLLLAAGFGERLKPITELVPKPLITVAGRTLLDRNLEVIARSGFEKVFINLHHLGEQIKEHVGDGSEWGLEIVLVEEETILDTGGAIKNIEPLLKHPDLVIVNSDILLGSDFDLRDVLRAHVESADMPMVTMVLRHDENVREFGEIGIDAQGRVVSFLGEQYGKEEPVEQLMYLGVQVLNRSVLEIMPARGQVFSVTQQTIRDVLKQQAYVNSFIYDGFWRDIGTPQRLNQASKDLVRLAEARCEAKPEQS